MILMAIYDQDGNDICNEYKNIKHKEESNKDDEVYDFNLNYEWNVENVQWNGKMESPYYKIKDEEIDFKMILDLSKFKQGEYQHLIIVEKSRNCHQN